MQVLSIDIIEADQRLEELIAAAEAGQVVFITREGRPVVRVEPISSLATPAAATGRSGRQGER